ncbi:MAG TPA: TPM domain-containing protein [Steroidobacteraceae bacterium]|jgi:uncharacterized protein
MKTIQIVFATFVLLVGVACRADTPKFTARVNDYAQVLQPDVKKQLESSLARYEKETTHQIVILTVPSLKGEPIEAYSLRVLNAWGLGRRGIDNGVLVTLAPSDRRARIELGVG